ncbi:cation:proton antiporter [Lichenihabitans sp. PAMC28606]|uniref:cation:proton antiporter domain-containing protein n=1 Tax=Lichenihabitans sp. PAMC28606 TaxID=2880932 RepID=UPI001D0B0A89|nr:cation:proton antiporter [Lichenihabitans sp. PAMC28606]UDL95889.1 cation:proton antiporter [Lichenihabitans sp. PAMC28606]
MTAELFPAGTREVLLFLATAGIVVPIFHRLRISPVLGFVLGGIALGPFGLGALVPVFPILSHVALNNLERVAGVAEFGVVFLLFMIGLELSFERLSTMRRLVFGLGPLQVCVCGAALALGAVLGLGVSAPVALVLGTALALSSTAIVVPVLAERKRLNSGAGRTAFAVLLFQDLAVAPLLFGVSLLSSHEVGGIGLGLLLRLAPAIVGIGVIVTLGRLILRPLFHHVASARSTELFMAASLFVVIGTSAITAAAGLSMAIGAFLAGLLLAETEYRREIEVTIEPFKGLLLGLFFVSVGADLDLSRLFADPLRIVEIAAGLLVVKTILLLGVGVAIKLPRRVAVEVALLLGPGGEFAFVIVNALLAAHVLDPKIGQDLLVAVTLTMIAIPLIAVVAERLGKQLGRRADIAVPVEPPPDDGQSRVIIVGFGRVGRLVSEMLTVHNVPFLAIDESPSLVARERAAGTPIYFGDATRPEFLRRCGLETARALVLTVSSSRVVEQVAAIGRAESQDLVVVARARDADHARVLYDLGVTDAVPETIEASLQLSEAVLVDVGVPMGLVIASVHEKRDEFRRLLNTEPSTARVRQSIRRPVPR